MLIGSWLLEQMEKCGLSAKLADEHRERSEDRNGFRDIRTEITRAWAVKDEPTLPEAHAAIQWLLAQNAEVLSVGETYDLLARDTGEVYVTGRLGAVLVDASEEMLAVEWRHADEFDAPEPEDELGLIGLALAASKGRAFRVATVALRELEVFPRRSRLFTEETHASWFLRVSKAASQPRDVACPGDWCGACRQRFHCPSWEARSKLALSVFEDETGVVGEDGEFHLEITNENAGDLSTRIKTVRQAADLAEEQLKAFVRAGGRCVVGGKEYYLGSRAGRKTADIAALERDGLDKYIKQGDPHEHAGWRKARR